MRYDDFQATRESIDAAVLRIDRIERTFGRLLSRFLWLLRLFLGGALVSLAKLCTVRDSINGL